MIGIMHSELLKMRHTVTLKLVFFAPFITVLIGYVLSPHDFQYSAYNWWYTMILPVMVSVWSATTVVREKNTGMQNVILLPVRSEIIWRSKMGAVAMLLLFSNLVLWGMATVTGYFTSATLSAADSLIGCLALFFTYLWQLPLIAWLTDKMGYLFAVFASSVCSIVLSAISAAEPGYIYNPYAIPARVVAPFLKMYPNGLPLESDSPLLQTGNLGVAVGVSLSLAIFLLWACPYLLGKGGPAHD